MQLGGVRLGCRFGVQILGVQTEWCRFGVKVWVQVLEVQVWGEGLEGRLGDVGLGEEV